MPSTRTDRPAAFTPHSDQRSGIFDLPRPKSIIVLLGVPIILALITWAAKPLAPVTTTRFVTDSARRETRYVRDSVDRVQEKAHHDSLLDRIDLRVGEIYCAGKAPGCR